MSLKVNYLFLICCLVSTYSSNGCQMEGVTVWQLPITVTIEDYHEGVFLQRSISDITGFTVTSYDDLNGGPYVDASIADSLFVLRTNDAYRLYEENETSQEMSLTFTFTCTGGTTSLPLTVRININDNNNNDPLFKTANTAASVDTTYHFTIAPPVPPGFLVTDCVSDIIVRDIDLTTYRIDFSIEDNPYIAIEYDEASSTEDKEFKAILKTTTFIRTLPEPIVLRISATDVDLTGDDPITTYTTVTIQGSEEFELPLEPVFTGAFYLANYNDNDQVTLEQTISLQQGYDDQVVFSLEGDYVEDNFNIVVTGNRVDLVVTDPLPAEALRLGQIFLVVRAARLYTSGASATIVVQLPDAVYLEFQQPLYEGLIVDNTLQLTPLILSQGYQGSTVTAVVEDYPSFFTALVVGNTITLSMTPLDANIIEENSFINVRITASTGYSSATTIVTLEIIKDDVGTPVFEKPLYAGTYEPTAGLTLEPLLLVQGYDNTVQITFSGDHASYFELVRDGASSSLRIVGAGLPTQVLSESHILLSVEASKPRTVGATAVVSITLPEARELRFEANTYRGSIQNNVLSLETITLNVGYNDDVTFSLSGDYSSSFSLSNAQNQVTVILPAQLSQEVIADNNIIALTVTATGLNALPTTAAVILDIIKDDVMTPVFSQPIYYGNYLGELDVDIRNINLVQGYDSSVTFRIEGENSEYFQINQNIENNVTLSVLSTIPEDVIFNEKVFVFNVVADKPLTVGANAAIAIKFSQELTQPTVMQFSKNTYSGSFQNNILTLEDIVLESGFSTGTEFHLTGDYASNFTTTVTNNLITLSLPSGLSAEILDNNKFIVLELEARRDRAVSVFTSVIVDLIEESVVTPVFDQAFYSGVYTEENVLQFEDTISLLQGYDDTVTFSLEGESATWFSVVENGNTATLIASSNVPQDVLDSNHHLLFTVVANKPNTVNVRSAISISLPKEVLIPEVLQFEQRSYEGRIDGSNVELPTITLHNEITENIVLELTGDHAAYFSVTHNLNSVSVGLVGSLPPELVSNNDFLVVGITASKPDAVSGYTTLVFSIVKEPQIVMPVFERPLYTGEFSEQDGLLFEHTIRLIQGFDDSVSFTLEGDGSEWFNLTSSGQNSLLLSVIEGGIQVAGNLNHIVFSVLANKPGALPGQAAISIHLTDYTDANILSFERASYVGTIENAVSTIETIVLTEGYTSAVTFTLQGDLASYFSLVVQQSSVNIVMQSVIPDQSLPANNIIMLELRAAAPQAFPAVTAVVFEVVRDNEITIEELVFSEPYYTGEFSEAEGLVFDTSISLSNGYDQTVQFALEGDHAQWFALVVDGNVATLALSGALPPAVIANNQQLVFIVTAQRPNTGDRIARATIVISLVDDYTDANILGFERPSYVGTIENALSTIETIVLTEGYTSAVTFTLQGDLASYFSLVVQESSVNIVLQNAIPDQSLPANNIIMLELRAAAPQAVPAVTAVVFEVVRDDDITTEELVFSEHYYTGQFSEAGGLVFDTSISLSNGYDQTVQFALEGDHAQWFALVVEGNVATLALSGALPPAVIANNQQLVFIVTAQRPNTGDRIARATIVISLVDDYTDANILGFERPSYVGTIENAVSTIETIVLTEGYTSAVTFTLQGDLASYFSLMVQESSVNIVLQNAIPDQSLPANNIIMLELRAAAPQAVPAVTAVVFEVVRDDDITTEELVFSEHYYTGQFSEAGGLVFDTSISLSNGYDQTVQFALEGDHAQWFALVVEGNVATLALSGALPPAVIANNQQLVFIVTAQRPNTGDRIARATIVISLVDDYTDANILGFERPSYVGTIVNAVSTIETIVLTEGYTSAVTFTLQGDLASYFSLVVQESSVNIVLQNAIPDQSLPANNIIMLELRAAAPQAVPAVTVVVFEVVRDDDITTEELVFSEHYYTGQFSEAGGLVFDTSISLSNGYDQTVQFALEGDHAQWFALVVEGNVATLALSGALPPAVIANNQQLVFIVTAQRPNTGDRIARATIFISLVDDYTDANILGFERPSYVGTIENAVSTIETIVLTEGYTSAVTFTLQGDLASYFSLVVQESSVNIVLQNAIPDQSLPANNIIMLELRAAAPQAVPAVTAVVFEVVRDDDITTEELVFSEHYYTGQFSEAGGLVFDTSISLSNGYDQTVQFALEGDHAQWFALVVEGNVATLALSGALPPAVIANNQQLVFIVTAQRPNTGDRIARATIFISLVDDYTDANILGFERPSYVGTIENAVSTIETIVLTEGYTSAVTFTLQGDLASYFSLMVQESSVNIVLQNAIPDQSLPANNIIMLELRAAAPQAVPAVTAVVFEVVRDDDITTEELVFSEHYYTGQFSEAGGLVFDTSISLSNGYDQTVQFALEGDHAQWFALVVEGNVATLALSGALPPAVIANNQQLVFIVTAQRPNTGDRIARATIVISLVDDYTDANILGFERPSYVGTIVNAVSTIETIVLTEGYTSAVTFTLQGDLASYFSLMVQESSVNIVLQNAIPDQSLPANNIIMLELRAAAPQAVPAVTAVVFEVVRDDDITTEELVFSEHYYTGQFSEAGGLVFDTSISLSNGYDQTVQFALEGDHAQWFALVVEGNVATLALSGALPPAVIANNQQLVFIVTAQRPNTGDRIARATIVISLVDDYTDANILGFERPSYVGTIENAVSTIETIVLTEGYTSAVTFTLQGDLASYFSLMVQESSVNIVLQNAIPDQSLPANNIIMLELRAAAPQAVPAVTAVVFEVVRDDDITTEELVFSEHYYTGQFSEAGGLVFDTSISLSNGYDQTVQFALEGDHAQWFALVVEGNVATLALSGALPPAVIANNQQLVFIVTAQRPNTGDRIARATIVISLVDDYTDANILGFERPSYVGTIENAVSTIETIVLTEGYTSAVTFTLQGDLASYFSLVVQESSVNIVLQNAIPDQSLPANNIIMLELRAAAPQAVPAVTAVVFEVVRDDDITTEDLDFSEPYYTGQFSEAGGLVFNTSISLSNGYDQNIQFALERDHAQWFTLVVEGNVATLALSGALPPAVIANNQQLVFIVTAQRPNTGDRIARATIVISLVDDYTDANILGFERPSYVGTIENAVSTIETIVLTEGYTSAVTFTLQGDLASYFSLVVQESSVNIVLQNAIPDQSLPANNIVMLELRAAAPQAVPAVTAVLFEVVRDDDIITEELVFSEHYYTGQFSETGGLVFNTSISLSNGYDQTVQFALEGDHAQWFTLVVEGDVTMLALSGALPPAVIANNQQLVFIVTAQRPNTGDRIARATIVISLVDDNRDANILGFERPSYVGTIENAVSTIETIVLTEGYTSAVTFTLQGDLASYFSLVVQEYSVNIVLQSAIPEQSLPANNIIVLELRAAAPQAVPAVTAVVFEVVRDDEITTEELVFSEPYYTGQFSEAGGLVFDTSISLSNGYDQNVQFALEGDHAQWFTLVVEGNVATLALSGAIPPVVIANNQQLVFIVTAQRPENGNRIATATIVITLVDGSIPNVAFDKTLYEGTLNLNVVQHEPITITGYDGNNVEIFGGYSHFFTASASAGIVTVVPAGSVDLPLEVAFVPLELRAGGASAVLLLDIVQGATPELPAVVFGSPSYVLRTDISHTGLVGRVSATASNGETVAYSLAVDNAHLQERVSVNAEGEIHLSAPANTGLYSFQVIATSIITQVQATATVHLTVDAASTCGEDDRGLSPLIILDRDEEEPHENLVILDSETHPGCQFRLTNRWPLEHDWLYVDENGLHARSIDREDPRIAFMALSQVQAELVLECPSDSQRRGKRSVESANTNSRLDWLGPYDYGSNKWILTDTILYNSRRSFVNLIVNDINDNDPIFVGKENEPIVVGYPIPELEEIVLPRALAELKATDADVGENAALRYWSDEDMLAVAPGTGSVHVRDGASLTDDDLLTISVTDRNGQEDGRTASIQLLVKLIDVRHIAVVTVRNAFLDQEGDILNNLTSAVGYEVKVLSSAVISDDTEVDTDSNTRHKKEVTNEGASLQLYVYGVIDREPVAVDKLSADITENVLAGVDVTRTISLEDHLVSREIQAGRDTALLVSTIVLSVLLFILIVVIAVWFILRWRKARNYEQFSDANSVASRNEPLEPPPKVDSLIKPRLGLEELKKSERRLQEMLDAPIAEVPAKPSTSADDPEGTFDTIINMAPPDTTMPIVIQSIDRLKDDVNSGDEDEFGERINKVRRKSVVTFNENVEKIIHVEDIPDDNSSEVEVFRF